MAQKIQILLVDDLDGGTAMETIGFALDGTSYEIDLSTKNASKFRDLFSVYAGSARRVSSRGRTAMRKPASAGHNPAEIRAWAKSKGIKVNDRGRVPLDLAARFTAENG